MPSQVYISGFSCRFPKANSPKSFWNNLINHVDMVSEQSDRWPAGAYGIPKRFGTLQDIEKFDASFFEVHPKQAHKMDPQLRKLLEVSYEAILDAGLQPETLRNKKVGVFIGAHSSDSQCNFSNQPEAMTGYENTGTTLSMLANRLSFYYDFTGPSMTIDTACSSSLAALDAAVTALQNNRCDYALVGGANLILNPAITVGFVRLQMVGEEGFCRSFDEQGKGYARSEGIGALFLSRDDAKSRKRARVLATGVNSDGHTSEGITFPNGSAHQRLLEETYRRAGIDIDRIEYIEAHGTGTPAGDPQEVNALSRFTSDRTRPLFIGSVKSNMGHAEGAAGMAGLIKVLLMMEHGEIPANLHFNQANKKITGLVDGTIKVVAENQAYEGGIVGINSFGFGGTNAHVVLEQHQELPAPKAETQPLELIPIPCRTADGHQKLIDSMHNIDNPSQFRNTANRPIDKFPYRHCLLASDNQPTQRIDAKRDSVQAEIWYVFNGMGSQWHGMGKAMLSMPLFEKSLQACHEYLTAEGFNLVELLSEPQPDVFAKPYNAFIGIAAIQIAMVDALEQLNIQPSGFVGHSIGEIAAAYADGAITKQQAMQIAYWRGQALEGIASAKGSMATVAINWETALELSSDGVFPACHNNDQSVTFSGSTEKIMAWCDQLDEQGFEVKRVDSAGIAFHSPLIAPAESLFRCKLEEILDKPKTRSNRWISTSYAKQDWHLADQASADYFVDNLLNQVQFKQGLDAIPEDAIVIEIGPHALLSSLIVSQKPSIQYIGLMRRRLDNNDLFYRSIAELYCAGVDINWSALYPEDSASFNQTATLNPDIDWNHETDWEVADIFHYDPTSNGKFERSYTIDISQGEFGFISDHILNGKILFPGVGYLYLVWQAMSEMIMSTIDETPIELSNVTLKRATTLNRGDSLTLTVRYLPATESFEVSEGENLIVEGQVKVTQYDHWAFEGQVEQSINAYTGESYLTGDDLYKELRLRGYDYGPAFKKVERISQDGDVIEIQWDGNWITFLDCLVHTTILRDKRQTKVPIFVRKITIDPKRQPNQAILPAYSEPYINQIYTHAVSVEGAKFTAIQAPKDRTKVALNAPVFTPYFETNIFKSRASQEVLEYTELCSNYIFRNAKRVIEAIQKDSLPTPQHIEQIERLIKDISIGEIDEAKLEHYLDHPKGISLRFAEYLYSDPAKLRDEPHTSILSFPEYQQVYKNDFSTAYLFDEGYLDELHQVVIENLPHKKPLRACEIGAGTGGMTHFVLPLMQSTDDRYTITDISAGFFNALQDEFKAYSAITQFDIWDINQQAPDNLNNLDLILASNSLHAANNISNSLKHIHQALSDDGFLLLHETTNGGLQNICLWGFIDEMWDVNDPGERTYGALLSDTQWQKALQQAGFEILSIKDDGMLMTTYLCRKQRRMQREAISNQTSLMELHNKLQQTLSKQEKPNTPLWVTGDSSITSGLTGMMNCLRQEESNHLRCLFFEDNVTPTDHSLLQVYEKDLFMNVFKQGEWGSYRQRKFNPVAEVTSGNAEIAVTQLGDLSSIHWTTSPQHLELDHDYDVYYWSLNFKDIMIASGKLSLAAFDRRLDIEIGGEFSGISASGERIMGYLGLNQKTKIKLKDCSKHHIWTIPDEWSLEDAATVPVIYMTVILALIIRGQMRKGDKVLIHSGSGGVGQAAIQVALFYGCEVFTTVGTEQKRQFIRKTFPQVPDSHIFSSRDTFFEKGIMNLTQGEGVNLILNSLSDDKLQAGLRLLGYAGKFLEIGKYDASINTQIGMEPVLYDCSVHGVGLDNIIVEDGAELELVHKLLAEGIASGMVKPITRRSFRHDDMESAFRFMAKGEHIGKVIVQVKEEDQNLPQPEPITCTPKFWCDPSKAYLITGGLGGFGLELADWLVQRGAKILCLTSRRGISNGYQRSRIDYFRSQGVNIIISTKNVALRDQTIELFSELSQLAPIGGVFHLAMVMKDAFFTNQSYEDFNQVVSTKLDSASNLDAVTREQCKDLQHFILFSSLVGSIGNPGQSAYAYANSGLDQLAQKRRQDGLAAVSIQWGAIADVGFVAENREQVHFESMVLNDQSLKSCLSTLDKLLCEAPPVVSSHVPVSKDFSTKDKETNKAHEVGDIESLIKDLKSILGLAQDSQFDEDKLFMDYGMDSLMGVEITQKLERDYQIQIPQSKIKSLNITKLRSFFTDSKSSTEPAIADYNFIPDREFPIFDRIDQNDIQTCVVYFLSGLLADPFEPLKLYPPKKDTTLFAVRYEHAESFDHLSALWKDHLGGLPEHVKNVKIMGYSTGATITHRMIESIKFVRPQSTITTTTISPPNENLYLHLQQIELAELQKINLNEGMERLQKLPIWGDYSMIPFSAIKKQVRFLMAEDLINPQYAAVDLIVLPSDDPVCWSMEKSKNFAQNVEVVDGSHDIRNICLTNYYN